MKNDKVTIKHGDHLTDEENQELIQLVQKYRGCFATEINELGMVTG